MALKVATATPLVRRAAAGLLQALLLLSLFWTALFCAWLGLSRVDFGYPLLYDLLDIGAHIDFYAPQNHYKSGFADTDRAQRLALFGQIVRAVERYGAGLAEIRYRDRHGRSFALLRPPERVHLESVARLISALRRFSYVMLGVLAVSAALCRALVIGLPSLRRVLLVVTALAAAGVGAVLAIGPQRVFDTLHVWVFPPNEQWFFYYQESLMTTLMKAPDLFGAIAVLLLLATLACFVALLAAARRLLGRAAS